MSTTNNNMLNCAACGKVGDGLKTCNGCKMVKYCNATCQRAHRPMHKRECKKRAAELHDEALFEESAARADCDVCFLQLPVDDRDVSYQVCCGKTLCAGCIHADAEIHSREICPFCRNPPAATDGEHAKRLERRAEGSDADAIHELGCYYYHGINGFSQDCKTGLELLTRAGELGNATSYFNIGTAYFSGEGMVRDMKKAKYYWELAAIGGYAAARHNLGDFEKYEGNTNRATKHFMIAARAGWDESLTSIRELFMKGLATKDDFEKALRAHKEAKDQVKSAQRDAAAATRAAYEQRLGGRSHPSVFYGTS